MLCSLIKMNLTSPIKIHSLYYQEEREHLIVEHDKLEAQRARLVELEEPDEEQKHIGARLRELSGELRRV